MALQFLSGLYSGMPITDEEGKVVSVITEIDLLDAVLEGRELVKITAEELMSKNPVTADVETPILLKFYYPSDAHIDVSVTIRLFKHLPCQISRAMAGANIFHL